MMRQILLLFLLGFAVTVNAQSFQGNYKHSDKGKITLYQFSGDSTLNIVMGKDTVKLTYAFDTAQSPLAIDVQYYDTDGNAGKRMHGIYEMVGKDKIRLRLSDNMDRPKGFLPKGNTETVLLIKEK